MPSKNYFSNPSMNPSKLGDLVRYGWRYFKRKHIDKLISSDIGRAGVLGTAYHDAVQLLEEDWDQKWSVAPDEICTPSGGLSTSKKALAFIEEHDIPMDQVLTSVEYSSVMRWAKETKVNALDILSCPEVEHEVEYYGAIGDVTVKGCADTVIDGQVIDWKTTAMGIQEWTSTFMDTLKRMENLEPVASYFASYVLQVGMYTILSDRDFLFGLQPKSDEHEFTFVVISEATKGRCQQLVHSTVEGYQRCVTDNPDNIITL